MAKAKDFGTDPVTLKFDLKYNDDKDKTKIQVDSTNYESGTVIYDSGVADQQIYLAIGNASSATWTLAALSVKFNSTELSLDSKTGTWGPLSGKVLSETRDGTLNVTATWVEKATGKKEPREDPVIIVNPTPNP